MDNVKIDIFDFLNKKETQKAKKNIDNIDELLENPTTLQIRSYLRKKYEAINNTFYC